MIMTFGDYSVWEIDVFFSRAYAMAIFALNEEDCPEFCYGTWRKLWDEKANKKDHSACELICACMIYRILEYENEPRLNNLLEDIRWRLEASKCGVNLDTLEQFKITLPPPRPANAETNTPSYQEGVISIAPQKEEKIKNAIKMLLAEKFGDRKIKFKSSNWFAVYKVYETHYQNGIDYVTFSNLMKQWQLTEKDIDNNISKATQTEDVKNLPNRISEWRDYRDKVNAAAKRHIDVALKFLELLR